MITRSLKVRWLHFSLRTLLIATAVIAVLLWIPIRRATRQRWQAIGEILRNGGNVRYDFQESAPPSLRRSCGFAVYLAKITFAARRRFRSAANR